METLTGYGSSDDENNVETEHEKDAEDENQCEVGLPLAVEETTSTSNPNANGVQIPRKQYKFLEEFELLYPPSDGPVDPVASENVRNFLASGENLMDSLRGKRQFGNPRILENIVSQLGIDEVGSNYPTHLFDPHGYMEEDFEDHIRRRYSDAFTTGGGNSGGNVANGSRGEAAGPTTTAVVNSLISSRAPAIQIAQSSFLYQQQQQQQQQVHLQRQVVSQEVGVSSSVAVFEQGKKRSRWDQA